MLGRITKVLERAREALHAKNADMKRPMTDVGGEIHDPTPVAPPIGYNPSLSFEERIRLAIQSEQLQHRLEMEDEETLSDMHDFGAEEDDDEIFPASRFEQVALDAQRMGAEYRRSKRERDRIEAAETRLADKIAEAIDTRDRFEELEVEARPAPPQRRRRPLSSGARPPARREGRQDAPQLASGNDDPE